MAAAITWNRLEPIDQSSDLSASLSAPIAAPLWLLHRQWQLGELRGNDAGSPIEVRVEARHDPLSRYRPGDPLSTDATPAVDYDPTATPLEATVEAERVRGLKDQHRRLAAETGLHFLRLLTAGGHADKRADYQSLLPVRLAPVPSIADPIGSEAAALLDERSMDGDALAERLRRRRTSTGKITTLPPSFPGASEPTVIAIANTWLNWYETLLLEPPGPTEPVATPDAWDTRRFEYQFAVAAQTQAANATFGSTAYDDGHLDWPDLSAGPAPDLGPPSVPPTAGTADEATIPVPISYPGMPAHRHWEIEDSRVNFASVEAGSTDILRMLLTEFALVYGDDWFVVPFSLHVGMLTTIRSISVRDTFGIISSSAPTGDDGPRRWAMYRPQPLSNSTSGISANAVLTVPSVDVSTSGPAIERVAFMRDEMANVVWAVEQITPSALGTPMDQSRLSQLPARVPVDVTDLGDAELVYRLATPVAPNWQPYVPRRTGVGDDITFERLAASTPAGVIARESASIEDEEVGSEGKIVERAWQYTRWINGQPILWLGRRVRSAGGEASSGLRWDVTESP